MERRRLTEARVPFVAILSIELLVEGIGAIGTILACYFFSRQLTPQCLGDLEAGGRFALNMSLLAFYAVIAIIAALMFCVTTACLSSFKHLFVKNFIIRIFVFLACFLVILILFRQFVILPSEQYCQLY